MKNDLKQSAGCNPEESPDSRKLQMKMEDLMLVADTPDKIRLFQLISVKHAIKLEKLGMRHSRFRCGVRGLWAKHYGMPPRSKADAVLARVQVEIDFLKDKIEREGRQPRLPLEELP